MDTKNPKLDNYFYKGQLRASTMLFSNLLWMGEDKDYVLNIKSISCVLIRFIILIILSLVYVCNSEVPRESQIKQNGEKSLAFVFVLSKNLILNC